ncbi:unnamed protein product [Rotaria sp. Silwood2]|nr:unnamed protein product [Rotaria sp. Silwood2]
MVAIDATWNGLTVPYFFAKDERLNGECYRVKLLPFYKEEGDRLFMHSNWCLVQDGATAHTDRKTQDSCKKNLTSFIPKGRWPSNSPDLNPLDYSIWDSINRNIDFQKVHTRDDL